MLGVAALLYYFIFAKNSDGKKTNSLPSLTSKTQSHNVTDDTPSSERLYSLPSFVGQLYADVIENLEYTDYYEFEIVRKEYQSNYPAGTVYKQSPEAESAVEKGTKVSLYVSLGPDKITVPNLIGCTVNEAKLKLFEAGFPFSSVSIIDKYDVDKAPSVIIEVDQKTGSKVSPDARITLYFNTYAGEEEEDPDPFPNDDPSYGNTSDDTSTSSR